MTRTFDPWRSLIAPPAVKIGRTRRFRKLDSQAPRKRAPYQRHGQTRSPSLCTDEQSREQVIAAMRAYKREWMRRQRATRSITPEEMQRRRAHWTIYMRAYRARKKAAAIAAGSAT
jgi:hypothetical protein